jgi:glycosyltransferase involved in cell wall biosynthesis
LPLLIYFHENQFVYPDRKPGPSIYQFTTLNFTSALAADRIAFNSLYNRDTFFQGIERYLKKAVDMNLMHLVEKLCEKADILYPGIDFRHFRIRKRSAGDGPPVIIWNHRWEHDKDPRTFFHVLYELADEGMDFRLIVLGQSFARKPALFDQARQRLQKNIIHFGYIGKREEYARQLRRGDIIISTAMHEFFGMAVLEAVRCGCLPIVPDRLAYREIFPKKYRYKKECLVFFLKEKLNHFQPLNAEEAFRLTDRYSWLNMRQSYQEWLRSVL